MEFNWTVDVSTLIAAGSFIFAVYKLHTSNVDRFARLETKVDMILREGRIAESHRNG